MIMPKLPSLASTVDGKRIEKLSDFKGELRNLWRDGTPEKVKKKTGCAVSDEADEYLTVNQAAEWFARNYPVKDPVQRIGNYLRRGTLTTYRAKTGRAKIRVSMTELKELNINDKGELVYKRSLRYNIDPRNIAYELGIPVYRVRQAISEGKVKLHRHNEKDVYFHDDFKALFGLE